MKLFFIGLLLITSLSARASLNSLEFLECFERASDEVITEIIHSENISTKRLCEKLSEKDLEMLHFKLSFMKNREIRYYSAEEVSELTIQQMYDYLKDHVNCYAPVTKGEGLIDAVINSPSYHRNLKLT